MCIAEAFQRGEAGEQFLLARNPSGIGAERAEITSYKPSSNETYRYESPANFQKPISGQRGPFPTADLRGLQLRRDKILANPNDHHFAQDPVDFHLGYVKLVLVRREPTTKACQPCYRTPT